MRRGRGGRHRDWCGMKLSEGYVKEEGAGGGAKRQSVQSREIL